VLTERQKNDPLTAITAMKKIKLISVFVILTIIELGFVLLLFMQYKKDSDLGQISSIGNFLVERHRYLNLIPITFGIIGPLKKKRLGWIFTAAVFYLLLIMGIAVGIRNEIKSIYEISTYLLFITTTILPLIIMNSNDFKQYYEIESGNGKILWRENIISMVIMTTLGTLLIVLNG